MATRTLAVMFTDIKGFTDRTSSGTRAGLRSLLEEHDRLVRPVFAPFGGVVVKTIGDAFLVTFESPTDAVLCGLTLQEVLRKYNADPTTQEALDVRVAINIGDIEERAGDIFGEAVNLAARLEGITEAGEVWFTEAVYLTMNRQEAPTAEVGERTFKGIPNPVRVYKVLFDPKSDQVKRVADRVKLAGGIADLESLKQIADRKTGPSRPLVIAAGGAIGFNRKRTLIFGGIVAVLLFGGLLCQQRSHERQSAKTLLEAESLLKEGRAERALAILEIPLTRAKRQRPLLESVAVRAATTHLEKVQREEGSDAAAKWLAPQLDAKPYLSPIADRLPELETLALLNEGAKTRSFPQVELDKLMEKYPNAAVIPYTAARIGERMVMPASMMEYYGKALDRGGYAGDAWALKRAEEVLGDFAPDARWSREAQRLLKKHYPKERLAWAEENFATGSAAAYLNALAILADEKDPRASDPLNLAIREALAGSTGEEVRKTLLEEKDPYRRARALALLRNGVKYMTVSIMKSDDVAALADALEKGKR